MGNASLHTHSAPLKNIFYCFFVFLNPQKNRKVIHTVIFQYVCTLKAALVSFFKVVFGTPCFFFYLSSSVAVGKSCFKLVTVLACISPN